MVAAVHSSKHGGKLLMELALVLSSEAASREQMTRRGRAVCAYRVARVTMTDFEVGQK